jgi:hypothetical protein
MGVLSNLKIRTKILLALWPLALMVVVVALYASTEMEKIDTWYSNLIDRDVKAQNSIDNFEFETALLKLEDISHLCAQNGKPDESA